MVPVSVPNAQLLGGQVAATAELSHKHPPAVSAATLHELWCEFGNTVNGAQTEDEAAAKELKRKAARSNPKHGRLLRSGSHHSHDKLLFFHFTPPPPPSCVSPDISLVLSEWKSQAAPHTETNRSMQHKLDFCISFE